VNITDWIEDRFGSTETKTLLDEGTYSTKELREDKEKIERKLDELEKELENHQIRYEHFLHKGADADEVKRQKYVQKSKFEKKKYKIKKKKYKHTSVRLGTIISIKGMREIVSMKGSENYVIDTHIEEGIDTQELQERVMDEMSEFGLELQDMQAIQSALDVEIWDGVIDTATSEELELMEEMKAGRLSKDQISLDDQLDVDSDFQEPISTEEADIDAELTEKT